MSPGLAKIGFRFGFDVLFSAGILMVVGFTVAILMVLFSKPFPWFYGFHHIYVYEVLLYHSSQYGRLVHLSSFYEACDHLDVDAVQPVDVEKP